MEVNTAEREERLLTGRSNEYKWVLVCSTLHGWRRAARHQRDPAPRTRKELIMTTFGVDLSAGSSAGVST